MIPDAIPRQVVYAVLRANLPYFGIACISLVAGISSLLLAGRRSRDRLLLWVGLFSTLYALRLFIQNELVRDAFNAPGPEFVPWVLCITYVIPIPFALFARELFGPGLKGTIAIWRWLEVAFAIIAIPLAFFGHQAYWTDQINSVLILAGSLIMLLHVLIRRKGANPFAASLTWPLVIFATLVILKNTPALRHTGGAPGGLDLEPVGFIILLAGLGWTAARRALASERKLIDVEQELATARRIQNSIIPDGPPALPSLHLAARYQPMTAVAGDFYDFLKTSEHLLTIFVADVSGHGVPAALVASMLKVSFAAQRERAHNPAEILAGLNVMLRGSLGGQYVTAACAAIDMESRLIIYAGAGHPPSLLVRRNTGKVVQLAENGLFIGPFPHAIYSNVAVPFESGDKLLLYTDGIIEASAPDGKEFGRERLEQFLLSSEAQQPADLIDRLFQNISSSAQQDDLTVVLAQFQ